MTIAIRVFALLVVFAGLAASTVSSRSALVIPSHQSASAAFPAPPSPCPSCDVPK